MFLALSCRNLGFVAERFHPVVAPMIMMPPVGLLDVFTAKTKNQGLKIYMWCFMIFPMIPTKT